MYHFLADRLSNKTESPSRLTSLFETAVNNSTFDVSLPSEIIETNVKTKQEHAKIKM